MSEKTPCELCEREVASITKHHLIPKTRHKNKFNKKNFSRSEVKERVIWICRPCHNNIHAVYSEKELAREYNTLEALQAQAPIQKFTKWIRNKPDGTRVPNQKHSRRR